MEKIHENVHVLCSLVNMNTKTYLIPSKFAYFSPPPPPPNIIMVKGLHGTDGR